MKKLIVLLVIALVVLAGSGVTLNTFAQTERKKAVREAAKLERQLPNLDGIEKIKRIRERAQERKAPVRPKPVLEGNSPAQRRLEKLPRQQQSQRIGRLR